MFEVYNDDFSDRFDIGHALSVSETIYYNDIGKLQLSFGFSDYVLNALKMGRVIYDTDTGTAFIIQHIKIDTASNFPIVCTAMTADTMLSRRCVAQKQEIVNIETDIYKMISDNLRGLERVTLAPIKGFADEKGPNDDGTPYSVYGEEILDVIEPLLEDCEMGRRMNFNEETNDFVFEIYKGRDFADGYSDIVFSEEQGTAQGLVCVSDDSDFKNFAFIAATLGNGEEIVEEVGAAENKYEMWISSKLKQEADETDEAFRSRLREEGRDELKKKISRQTFQLSAKREDLKKYELGDKIACCSVRLGVEFVARITSIRFTKSPTAEKTEITLGEPILTALGVR